MKTNNIILQTAIASILAGALWYGIWLNLPKMIDSLTTWIPVYGVFALTVFIVGATKYCVKLAEDFYAEKDSYFAREYAKWIIDDLDLDKVPEERPAHLLIGQMGLSEIQQAELDFLINGLFFQSLILLPMTIFGNSLLSQAMMIAYSIGIIVGVTGYLRNIHQAHKHYCYMIKPDQLLAQAEALLATSEK